MNAVSRTPHPDGCRWLRRLPTQIALLGLTVTQTPLLAQAPTAPDAAAGIDEVIVTATRRAEPLSKVAISVSTISAEQMDARGVKSFDDLVRLTPGLNLTRSASTGSNQIAIRGISSDAGSGTTGVYIDDTPIQVRNLGFGAGNAFPGLFDIERVEVLRGPQGTLFGAGSEGGTVRFLQTGADVSKHSSYVRAEASTLQNGSPSYEAGGAIGGPLIADRLGYRVSAFYRRDGGYIDAVNGTYQILDPTGAAYGDSVAFARTQTIATDVNWARTVALRAALKFTPSDAVTITPSVFYQKHYNNDGGGSDFDLATSNSKSRNYARQYYLNGDPASNSRLNAINVPNNQFGDDEFTLSAVGVSWDLGKVELVSNTSYFDREELQWYDYTKGYAEFYVPQDFLAADGSYLGTYAPLGWKAMSRYGNTQGNFIQELRLQSKDSAARVSWLAGAFFSHNRQSAEQPISQNFLINAPVLGFSAFPDPAVDCTGTENFCAITNGSPFGPGHSASQNFFGDNMLANGVSFLGQWRAVEEQLAGFGELGIRLLDPLKLTLGVRVSRNKFDFNAAYLGAENNANAPFGLPCPDGPGSICTFGSGTLAPAYPRSEAHNTDNAVTPKIGFNYQITDANLLYFTAAKGFRPAGASLQVPSICDAELAIKGYATQPLTYKSDSVWSYELGSKNRMFGGRLVLDASVYQIKWKNIQTNVSLPSCAYNFVDNLADATSEGFDLSFEFQPIERLAISGALGYNNPRFDRDATSPGNFVVYSKGASIPDAGAPITVSLSSEYALPLRSGHQAYVRADYTHTSEWRRTGDLDPSSGSYDSRLKPVPAFGVLNLRFGARLAGADLSLFIQNLTDEAPALGLFAGSYYDPQDWTNNTLRARTYGLTLTWRH